MRPCGLEKERAWADHGGVEVTGTPAESECASDPCPSRHGTPRPGLPALPPCARGGEVPWPTRSRLSPSRAQRPAPVLRAGSPQAEDQACAARDDREGVEHSQRSDLRALPRHDRLFGAGLAALALLATAILTARFGEFGDDPGDAVLGERALPLGSPRDLRASGADGLLLGARARPGRGARPAGGTRTRSTSTGPERPSASASPAV